MQPTLAKPGRTTVIALAAIAGSMTSSTARAVDPTVATLVGHDALVARLGPQAPTGAGVEVAQVEVFSAGNYGPNQADPEFADKIFIPMSGDPGASLHATTVGYQQYGADTSIAPDISAVYLYESNNWVLSGYLNFEPQGIVHPTETPGAVKLVNASLAVLFGSPIVSNDVLRRSDFVANRDQVLFTAAVNNGGQAEPLLSHMFNGLAVGVREGTHTSVPTISPYDGPGRQIPHLVAPSAATSFATPIVNAAAALLVETSRTLPRLQVNTHSERTELYRAVLLASATHEDLHDGTWTNEPGTGPDRGVSLRPLDEQVGAGTVNVDRAQRILAGAETSGTDTPFGGALAPPAAWDIATMEQGTSRFLRFIVPPSSEAVSVVAAWNRRVSSDFDDWTLADFDLELWRVDDGNRLESLVGSDGIAWFESGNVVSASPVDNVEHLWIDGLFPGHYVLEVRRVDELPDDPTWDVAVAWRLPAPEIAPQDLDGDGLVGFADLSDLLAAWGPCEDGDDEPCTADLSGDDNVGFEDLFLLLAAWDD